MNRIIMEDSIQFQILLLPVLVPTIVFLFYRRYEKKQIKNKEFAKKLYHKNFLFNAYIFAFFGLSYVLTTFIGIVRPTIFSESITGLTQGEINASNVIVTITSFCCVTTSYFLYVACRRKIIFTITQYNFLTESLKKRLTISKWCGLILFLIMFLLVLPNVAFLIKLIYSLFTLGSIVIFIETFCLMILVLLIFYSCITGLKVFILTKSILQLPVYQPKLENNNAYRQINNPALKLNIQSITIFGNQKTFLPEIHISKTTYFQLIAFDKNNLASFILVYPMFMKLFEEYIIYEDDKAYITIPTTDILTKITQSAIMSMALNQIKEQNENKL